MGIIFRCRICSEAYLLSKKPSQCPVCGAHGKWVVTADSYVHPEIPALTGISRKNLEFTYNLEVNAAKIYHCIMEKTGDIFIQGMFKAISKVELEHAELVGKLIGKDPGCEIAFAGELCTEERAESLIKTERLEATAIKHYTKFLQEATEPGVIDIFQALVEIESDHLEIVQDTLSV